jgi:hypothetical protein
MALHGESTSNMASETEFSNQNLPESSTLSPVTTVSTLNERQLTHGDYEVDLPSRVLSNDANLAEFIVEVPSGHIPGPLEPNGQRRYRLVTFQPNDPENPKNWSKAFKWYITMVVAVTCFVVAFSSSVVTPDIAGVAEEFNVSQEVALLSITLFVVGFGIGEQLTFFMKVSRSSRNFG